MNEFLTTSIFVVHQVNEPTVGMLCAALFVQDGSWYRARVLSIKGSRAEVLFLDYGNTEQVVTSSLKTLESQFTRLPTQAIRYNILFKE